jgi:A/G-specific adenine glycosylase
LVDGNVERVYARVTGDASAGPSLTRAAWAWAERELYRPRPGDWNQALMELGATVCKPVKPACTRCPLEGRCVARQSWRVDELPTKVIPRKAVHLRHAVWVPLFEGEGGLRQIPELRELVGPGWLQHVGQVRHSVTHHRIVIDVSVVRCESRSPHLRWLRPEDLTPIPMPNPQRRVLKLVGSVL